MTTPRSWPNPNTGGVSSLDDKAELTVTREELTMLYRALEVASDHAGELIEHTGVSKTEARRVLIRLHDRAQEALWDLDGVPKKERLR